jgi:hypothetical protein
MKKYSKVRAPDLVRISSWLQSRLIQRRRVKVDEAGIQMRVAIEIDLALWGMIICATMKAGEFFELF